MNAEPDGKLRIGCKPPNKRSGEADSETDEASHQDIFKDQQESERTNESKEEQK